MAKGQFTKSLERFVSVTSDKADEAIRKIAFGLLSNVVAGSPVDTGRFRGNWQIGVGARPATIIPNSESRTGTVVESEAKKLQEVSAGSIIWISNTLPYAYKLEFGHSQQAPSGIVRLAMRNIKQIVEGAVK